MTTSAAEGIAPDVQAALSRLFAHPTVTVADAALVLGVSRATIYAYARSGELRTVQFGHNGRRRVPSAVLLDLLGLLRDDDPSKVLAQQAVLAADHDEQDGRGVEGVTR